MIKKFRENSGLRSFYEFCDYIDPTPSADYTFQVYDFPDRLYLGKNSFKLLANTEFLANNAPIIIDIEDKSGSPIYYEISNIINRDGSRTVLIYVYDDTKIGNASIFIASTLKKNPDTNTIIESDGLNVIWKKDILVSTSQVSTEPIIFSNPPTIVFSERVVQKRIFSGTGSRYIELPNRGSSLISILPSTTLSDYAGRSTGPPEIDMDSATFHPVPQIIDNRSGVVRGPIRIPTYQNGSIIKTRLFPFSASMVGGTVTVRNIDVSSSAPDVVANTIPTTTYSGTLMKIINETTAEIYPPFIFNTTYTIDGVSRQYSVSTFKNQANFTASWLQYLSSSNSISQSFLNLEFQNLQPTLGYIESIRVSYKEIGGFGQLYDLGQYRLSSQNLLSHTSSVEFTNSGLEDKQLGFLQTGDIPSTWWFVSSSNVLVPKPLQQTNTHLQSAILVSHQGVPNSASYAFIGLKSAFHIDVLNDSQYRLDLLVLPESTGSLGIPQLDIYISGSDIVSDVLPIVQNKMQELDELYFGTYIGTVISPSGSYKKFSSIFKTAKSGRITPVFVLRDGLWVVGQVGLYTVHERGYNTNHAKLNIPLPIFPARQELVFEIEYLNSKNEPSEFIQYLSGLYFRGSDTGSGVFST